MDEEFFFPQNVTTTYRIFGMGPRHLKRAGAGLAGVLPVAMLLARYVGPLPALVICSVLLVAFVGACAYPTFGEESLSDILLHMRVKQRSQTAFAYEIKEVMPRAEPGAPPDHGAPEPSALG